MQSTYEEGLRLRYLDALAELEVKAKEVKAYYEYRVRVLTAKHQYTEAAEVAKRCPDATLAFNLLMRIARRDPNSRQIFED